jgi:hypothetical protein
MSGGDAYRPDRSPAARPAGGRTDIFWQLLTQQVLILAQQRHFYVNCASVLRWKALLIQWLEREMTGLAWSLLSPRHRRKPLL